MSHFGPRLIPVPFATPRDLYVLVAGVVLGALLGPAVLGRVAPETYERWFVGGGELAAQVQAEEASLREELARLEMSGVSEVAVREHENRRMTQMLPLRVQLDVVRTQRARTISGWMTALIVATLIVMVVEALTSPQPPAPGAGSVSRDRGMVVPVAVARLITIRYALLAVWLAIALAQPTALRELPVAFTLLLLAVALAAAFVPLGKGR